MPLVSLAPKEVYRVYGEEEFLACVDLRELAATDCSAHAPPTPPRRRSRRGQREAPVAVAALAGVCALLYVLLAPARTSAPGWHLRASGGRDARTAPARPTRRNTSRDAVRFGVPVRRLGGTPAARLGVGQAVGSHVPSERRSRRSPHEQRSSARATGVRPQALVAAPRATPPAVRTPASSAAVAASAEFGFER